MKIKNYDKFIKSINESISFSYDRRGNLNSSDDYGKHIKHLSPDIIDDFIEQMVEIVELNHEILSTNLSERVGVAIDNLFEGHSEWYFKPVDLEERSSKFHFRYDDISLAFAMLINLGYSIGYLTDKYNIRGWNYSEFFGYEGEVFTTENDFKKVSSHPIVYEGPDVTHCSILAGTNDIAESLSSENIKYIEEEQGGTEISVIFTRPFLFGLDCGRNMLDEEKEFYYKKLGTTKDRYYDLIVKRNRTENEEEELREIERKEDVLRYGEEYVKKREEEDIKDKEKFDSLSKEEQDKIRSERQQSADEIIRRMLNNLDNL